MIQPVIAIACSLVPVSVLVTFLLHDATSWPRQSIEERVYWGITESEGWTSELSVWQQAGRHGAKQ